MRLQSSDWVCSFQKQKLTFIGAKSKQEAHSSCRHTEGNQGKETQGHTADTATGQEVRLKTKHKQHGTTKIKQETYAHGTHLYFKVPTSLRTRAEL